MKLGGMEENDDGEIKYFYTSAAPKFAAPNIVSLATRKPYTDKVVKKEFHIKQMGMTMLKAFQVRADQQEYVQACQCDG